MTNPQYILAPYFSLGFSDYALEVGFGSIYKEIKNNLWYEIVLDTCVFLKQPRTLIELSSFIKNHKDAPKINPKEIIHFFIHNRFLIEEGLYKKEDRHSRALLYYNLSGANPQRVQEKLSKKHVAICGCGGIGNVVSVTLATAGIDQLTLVDEDTIELSNLSRQIMFREQDAEKKKVDMLAEQLKLRNATVQIHTIDKFCKQEQDFLPLKKCDLIVVSGDSKNICLEVNKFAYKFNIPFIKVGYILDKATWGPFIIPGKTPCYLCFNKQFIADKTWADNKLLEKVKLVNTGLQAPSTGPINLLASSMACLDIIKFLGDFGKISSLHQRANLWTHELGIQYQPYKSLPNCNFCNLSNHEKK
ncbi:MAG: ThiF family adenylyltransferase [Bacteroidota bacterium]